MTDQDVQLSALQAAALPAVMSLEQACFAPADRWSEASWRFELEQAAAAPAEPTAAQRAAHSVCAITSEHAAQLAALAAFSVVAEDAELLRVMTHPQQRRRGLAAKLLAAGLSWARRHQATRMLLEVEADNQPAIQLYHDFGFEHLTLRADYYGPGRAALIMTRELNRENLPREKLNWEGSAEND